MKHNFQRIGATSNSDVGSTFEKKVRKAFLETTQMDLSESFQIPIGNRSNTEAKRHRFDLGSHPFKVIVECKCHTWTSGNNVPSAKLTTWDQAMYYFHLIQEKYKLYRQIFVVVLDRRKSTSETLLEYYWKHHQPLIPDAVELWEYDEASGVLGRFSESTGSSYFANNPSK